jgi:chemotaxis protein MotB
VTVLRKRRPIDIWPAFVDAIASLLMVVIFVVLIAAVGQLFLTDAILGRDRALARVNARISELADLLSMQQAEGTRLTQQLALRTASLAAAQGELISAQTLTREQQALLQERATIVADQERTIALTETQANALEDAKRALTTHRDQLRRELDTTAATRDDVMARLSKQNEFNSAARVQIAHLNRQLEELSKQLARVSQALEIADADGTLKAAQINDLGERLNLALAAKTTELQRYRSEFFGRLRDALGEHPEIRIVGDRFVLPSELLFESASDELGPGGKLQVKQLAETLQTIAARIPDDLD